VEAALGMVLIPVFLALATHSSGERLGPFGFLAYHCARCKEREKRRS
jgi:hypothetical protein